MTLKTVTVNGTLYNPDGSPAANVKGTARLTRYETDDGVVVPSLVRIETDEAGEFAIELWPNERGSGGSQYRVEVAGGRQLLLNVLITVPDVEGPVALEDIINQAPYPPVDQAQQAVALAQAAALEALGYRDETSADRLATGLDRIATGEDRIATGEDRQATAADREQTGLDRIATQSDREQTGLDRVQTGLDRIATGQDREQTGLDRTATGEDRNAAAGSAVLAQKWATQVDAEVVEGEGYGAKKYAIDAADSANDAAQFVIDTNDRLQFMENVLQVMRYGDGPYPIFEHYFIGPNP